MLMVAKHCLTGFRRTGQRCPFSGTTDNLTSIAKDYSIYLAIGQPSTGVVQWAIRAILYEASFNLDGNGNGSV